MFKLSVFLALLPILAGCHLAQAYYDKDVFKELVYNDDLNDDAINMDAPQLITRSGYKYEEHYVVADDGYVTQLLRLVNPKADPSKLKSPPVLLFHGANIDNSAYLLASSIQHHPETYPRSADAEPMTSSNRSLAFMLANNGYDVWLMSTRGSNEQSQAFVEEIEAAQADPSFKPTDLHYKLIKENKKKYWSYGLDDIIKYELKNQIDKVRHLTRSDEVSIFAFSLSTPTTMVFLANNPDYARKVRLYTQMAPAIAADHFTTLDRIYFERLCPQFPTRGLGFTPTYLVKPIVAKAVLKLSKYKKFKYSYIEKFLTALFGPTLKYHTNLERNFLARVFRPVSFKSIQQYCKNSAKKRLTKFDYGPEKNMIEYGQETPPVYDVDNIDVQHWFVISGTYDALADADTVLRLIETTTSPNPVEHWIAPGFNHADFLAAVENDKYVNFKYLEKLNQYSY